MERFWKELNLGEAAGSSESIFLFLRRKHNVCMVWTPEKIKMCTIYVGTSTKKSSPSAQIWL
jgi:hypothetical protein